MRFYFQ